MDFDDDDDDILGGDYVPESLRHFISQAEETLVSTTKSIMKTPHKKQQQKTDGNSNSNDDKIHNETREQQSNNKSDRNEQPKQKSISFLSPQSPHPPQQNINPAASLSLSEAKKMAFGGDSLSPHQSPKQKPQQHTSSTLLQKDPQQTQQKSLLQPSLTPKEKHTDHSDDMNGNVVSDDEKAEDDEMEIDLIGQHTENDFVPESLRSFIAQAESTLIDTQASMRTPKLSFKNVSSSRGTTSSCKQQQGSFEMTEDDDDRRLKEELMSKFSSNRKTIDEQEQQDFLSPSAQSDCFISPPPPPHPAGSTLTLTEAKKMLSDEDDNEAIDEELEPILVVEEEDEVSKLLLRQQQQQGNDNDNNTANCFVSPQAAVVTAVQQQQQQKQQQYSDDIKDSMSKTKDTSALKTTKRDGRNLGDDIAAECNTKENFDSNMDGWDDVNDDICFDDNDNKIEQTIVSTATDYVNKNDREVDNTPLDDKSMIDISTAVDETAFLPSPLTMPLPPSPQQKMTNKSLEQAETCNTEKDEGMIDSRAFLPNSNDRVKIPSPAPKSLPSAETSTTTITNTNAKQSNAQAIEKAKEEITHTLLPPSQPPVAAANSSPPKLQVPEKKSSINLAGARKLNVKTATTQSRPVNTLKTPTHRTLKIPARVSNAPVVTSKTTRTKPPPGVSNTKAQQVPTRETITNGKSLKSFAEKSEEARACARARVRQQQEKKTANAGKNLSAPVVQKSPSPPSPPPPPPHDNTKATDEARARALARIKQQRQQQARSSKAKLSQEKPSPPPPQPKDRNIAIDEARARASARIKQQRAQKPSKPPPPPVPPPRHESTKATEEARARAQSRVRIMQQKMIQQKKSPKEEASSSSVLTTANEKKKAEEARLRAIQRIQQQRIKAAASSGKENNNVAVAKSKLASPPPPPPPSVKVRQSDRRRLTVPETPRLSTLRKYGKKKTPSTLGATRLSMTAAQQPTMAESLDSFNKGLRQDLEEPIKRSGKPRLTVPKPFHLHEKKDTKQNKVQQPSLAESLNSFDKGLRHDDVEDPGKRSTRPRLTVPKPFHLHENKDSKPIIQQQPSLAEGLNSFDQGLRHGPEEPIIKRSEKPRLTVPKPFHLHEKKDTEPATEQQLSLAESLDSFDRGLRHNSEEPVKRNENPRLTVPKPFHLHENKNTKTPISQPTMAESLNSYLSKGLREVPASTVKRDGKLTVPRPPRLSEGHKRPLPKSTEQIEEEEMREFSKKQFHARPNPSFKLPPPTKPKAKGTTIRSTVTTPKPFHLSSTTRSEPPRRTQDEVEMSKQFHARKLPLSTFVPPKISAKKPSSIVTPSSKSGRLMVKSVQPPKLSTASRTEKRQAMTESSRKNAEVIEKRKKRLAVQRQRDHYHEELSKAGLINTPERNRVTQPVPFHLESERRHEASVQMMERQREREEEEAEQQAHFKARPLHHMPPPPPKLPSSSSSSSRRSLTQPKPFRLISDVRHEHSQRELKEKIEEANKVKTPSFRARPVPSSTYKTITPTKPQARQRKALVVPYSPVLSSVRRAEERKKFDEAAERQRQEEAAQKKEIQERLRQEEALELKEKRRLPVSEGGFIPVAKPIGGG